MRKALIALTAAALAVAVPSPARAWGFAGWRHVGWEDDPNHFVDARPIQRVRGK